MAAPLLSPGALLIGRLSTYTIARELHRAADEAAVYLARTRSNQLCIVKSIRGHWRLQNEAAVLQRYQGKTPFIRPLVDEIQTPKDPPSIVLRHLDSDMLAESAKERLSRTEIKHVARCVLEALRVLHKDGMVHTDVKLDNVFCNHGHDGRRFADIQLGDFGGAVSNDSQFAKEAHLIGAGFTRSPEATFQVPWDTATDIWSFGAAILSLVYGGGYHLFNPGNEGIKSEDEAYELTVLRRMHRFFGPFPQSYESFKCSDTMTIINFLNGERPPEKPFTRITSREVPPADKTFLLKIMKLDPRDRPTAEDLLADGWFSEESQDTRDPLPGESGDDEQKKG